MDRREQITRFITPQQRGIEIGPFCNPLAPKRLGFNCLVLDVCDAATLRQKAKADPAISAQSVANIEEVDLVGPYPGLVGLAAKQHPPGSFDYILSSHDLQRMPDPIRFLQDCQTTLKPGGVLSMAVPDRRACFDYFRPHTTLADWLEAYFENRQHPSAVQVFRQHLLHCRLMENEQQLASFTLEHDPLKIRPLDSLQKAFADYKTSQANLDEVYRDVHCWAFTPASLEWILQDMRFLALFDMEIQQITATYGNEFYVRLCKQAAPPSLAPEIFYEQREKLMHRINDEASENSMRVYQMRRGRDRTGSK
jgi:SAM-dependent methyltransferase